LENQRGSGDVIRWDSVANTSQYEFKLYRGTTLVTTQRVGSSVTQHNNTSQMTSPGAYTATVQAIGDQTNYLNGPVSVRSNKNRKTVTLAQVQKPTWNGDAIWWNSVANASQYELKLFRGTTLVNTQQVGANVRQHNFASRMTSPGAYTVTVQAIGDNRNYRSGPVSVRSNRNNR
jgi:hypothetical protein